MYKQLINNEDFTSIKEAQAGLTKLLEKAEKKGNFYRVLRNNEPIGVLVPSNVWSSLIEDLEALSSPSYIKSIAKARKEGKEYSSQEVKNMIKKK